MAGTVFIRDQSSMIKNDLNLPCSRPHPRDKMIRCGYRLVALKWTPTIEAAPLVSVLSPCMDRSPPTHGLGSEVIDADRIISDRVWW
jgi:hypothetical protein